MLSCYIGSVWSLYWLYQDINLSIIFMPMLLTGTLELSYYLYILQKYYHKMSQEPVAADIPFKVLFLQRCYNYCNQITKAVYSPNSMTLFFTYLFGFQQAADIKFFTTLITLLYTCIAKSIGVTTGAIFSAINHMSITHIQSFFINITKRYFQFLYLLTGILTSVVGYAWQSSYITGIMAVHILIFFSISFLEHVSITYKQLFMSQAHAWQLALINLSGLIIIIPSFYAFACNWINQSIFLIAFLVVKVVSLWIISYAAHIYWKISLKNNS